MNRKKIQERIYRIVCRGARSRYVYHTCRRCGISLNVSRFSVYNGCCIHASFSFDKHLPGSLYANDLRPEAPELMFGYEFLEWSG